MVDPTQLHVRGEWIESVGAQVSQDFKNLQEMIQILCGGYEYFDEQSRKDLIEPRRGSYRYIPYDLGMFLELIMDLKNLLAKDPHYAKRDGAIRRLSFLEVGCGIGRNLLLLKRAKSLRFQPLHGIEIARHHIEQARQWFGLDENVIEADAMKFDYSTYDVIYFFKPFEDDKLERRFQLRLLRQLKPGGYVMSPLGLEIDRAGMEATHTFRIWRKALADASNGAKTVRPKGTKTRRGR